jgi:hypothetical protein
MPNSVSTPPSPESAQSPTPATPQDALSAFRARLASGRFSTVLGAPLRRTIRDAATDPGLDAEVGALRLALARLLTEERDPSRLAAGVARLTAVAVQAARLRQSADDDPNDIRAILARALAELDADLAAEQTTPPFAIAARDRCDPAAPPLDDEGPPLPSS